ncbi:hypothetical protein AB9P05_00350 [Roseivirga sp. BDSF3-8]|uniref:hypothetical protein n=1 Tax=Roseivirga sp. BDSF3-8 TaxID=3241598 RepID=UPI0035324192
MKHLLLSILLFLPFIGHSQDGNQENKNLLVITDKGGSLAVDNLFVNQKDSTANLDQESPILLNLDSLVVDFSQTNGVDPKNLQVFKGESSESCLKNNQPLDSTYYFKDLIDTQVTTYDNNKTYRITLLVEPEIEFKIGNIGNNTNTSGSEEIKICDDPSFYTSQQRLSTPISLTEDKNFHNIYHDLNSENRGPVIYHKDSIKKRLKVNTTGNLTFVNFAQNFEKIEHTLTFKDYHLEDGETFKSLINLGKKEAKEAEDDSGDDTEGEGDTVNLTSNDDINPALDKLIKDLTQFQDDLKAYNIGSIEKKNIVADIKSSIKSCFDMDGEFSYNNFLKHIKTNGGDEELANEALAILQWIENYSNLLIPGFQVKNVDELIIELDYYENVDDENPKYKRTYEIPILGGMKLDFSTGVIGSGMVDENFLIVNAGSRMDSVFADDGSFTGMEEIEQKKVIKEEDDDFKIGFGVLSHIYPRISTYVNLSLTAGFMVEEDLAVQFPVGGSVLLGRKSRFILSGGFIFGKAQRLSSKYQLNEVVDASVFEGVDESQLTKEKTNRGYFMSITYNFAGVNVGN